MKQWQDELLKKEENIKDLPRMNQVKSFCVRTCGVFPLGAVVLREVCCVWIEVLNTANSGEL